jgi:hypothetical protein
VDCFVSGEVGADDPSGPGVGGGLPGVGHHASERYGVQALGLIWPSFGIEAEFVEVDNPV